MHNDDNDKAILRQAGSGGGSGYSLVLSAESAVLSCWSGDMARVRRVRRVRRPPADWAGRDSRLAGERSVRLSPPR